MLKETPIPDSYRDEFFAQQTKLTQGRVSLLTLASLGIYFITSFFLILIRPEEFKTEEIPAWGILLAGGTAVFLLNRSTRTLGFAKGIAYLFTVLFLYILVRVALIYPEDIGYSSIYYVLALFFVSLIIPWTAQEVVLLALLDGAAYTFFFAFRTGIFQGASPAPAFTNQYVDGLILISIAFVMCLVIRLKETARDIENFVLLKQVEEKNEQIQKELELARRIHKTLIPESVRTERADITVSYLPVHYIGGDYAKFHFLERDRLIFIISDVTGHGVPAALLVNRIHAEFERLAKEDKEPGILLKELDEFISEDFDGTNMYLTAFCGLLDFEKSLFFYSNYGHPPQYIYHASRGEVRSLSSQTTLLGLSFREQKVYQAELRFDRGDRILLFTDGIFDVDRSNPEAFGAERIKNFLKAHDGLKHPEFNQKLLEELNASKKGEFRDDIFLLSIKIN